MSASWPDNMRGPRMKTHLLLLLVLAALTGTVFCQDDVPPTEVPETTPEAELETEPENYPVSLDGDGDPEISADLPPSVDTEEHTSGDHPTYSVTEDPSLTDTQVEEDGLNPIIIMIPVVLVIVIIAMIVCGIFISRRWTKNVGNQGMSSDLSKEDPYLDGSSTEKVPMPMFEEDVPSVLELEMEELDQWMKKDTETADDSTDA